MAPESRSNPMDFRIAPFRALRFNVGGGASAADLVAPPYDVISPDDHRALLERSPNNIVRLTLGDAPGRKERYETRAQRLLEWIESGTLRVDGEPALFVYGCDYTVPGTDQRASFRGLAALGEVTPFEDGVVLPHEQTFPDVVDDRFHLLDATRTHLESIFVLYEDHQKTIDALLEEASSACPPDFSVEAKSAEVHSLWTIQDAAVIEKLCDLFRAQHPMIADGHHRYTTALQYRNRKGGGADSAVGSNWQPMVFGNLVGDGLSILATHRLVNCRGQAERALEILREKLEPSRAGGDGADASDWEYCVETRDRTERFRVPDAIRSARSGVAASDYAILHELVIDEWFQGALGGSEPIDVQYFKEGSGEREALERGDGDLLVRMQPVPATEFRSVVEGGEVFPHKTTFFYPKLWSGLVFWQLESVEAR